MRHGAAVFFLGLILSGGDLLAGNPVVVYHSSFESAGEDTSGLPEGWKLLSGGPVRLDGTVAHTGKRSLALTAMGTRQEIMTQATFPFEPYGSLQISLWSQSELKAGKAALVVYWFDRLARKVGTQVLDLPAIHHPWTKSTFLIPPPAAAARLGFHLEFTGNGTLWVDDLTATQAVRPRSGKFRGTGKVGKIISPTTQPIATQPTSRKSPSLLVRLSPEGVHLKRGQAGNIQITVSHTRNQPTQIHFNIALFHGSRNANPIGTRIYQVTIHPKQIGKLNYTLETADLPAGSYRLVCHAETQDETCTASLPIDIQGQGKQEVPVGRAIDKNIGP